MVTQLKDELEYIISNKKIRTVFQPIISLRDGSVLGHEALSRITCESEIKSPDMLFSVAGEYNRLWDLELLCRTTALEAAYKFMIPPYNKKLFVNVNPNIMYDESYKKGFTKAFLEQYQIAPNNVIFEITERNVITDLNSFKDTIGHYKSQDFKIAIDDAGAGYSGLNLISDVNPNYIKLDMKLIRNVDEDSLKYALLKGMVEFSKASNICLIAEGIETFEELNTLVNLGVQYGQGYFIQKPDPEIREISPEVLQMLKTINQKKNHTSQSTISNLYIGNLCVPIETVSPNEDEKYMGVVTIKNLLKKTTELEISAAKHQNPLTGIPGSLIIEQKLNQFVIGDGPYSVAYLDIDNFKAYNDVYGFENGDLVIKLLADILRSNVPESQFVGHIGGDDFVVIINNHISDFYFKDLRRQFEYEVLAFYNERDIENGYISTTNRQGDVEKFPLTTLTAVAVNNKTKNFTDVYELTEMLAAMKKISKQSRISARHGI